MGQVRLDLAAAAASVFVVVMLFVYLTVIRQQDGQPAVWAAAVLVLGAAGAGYGAFRDAPYRRAALLSAACGLAALGLLAILSIGAPILVASVFCLVAAVRQRPATT